MRDGTRTWVWTVALLASLGASVAAQVTAGMDVHGRVVQEDGAPVAGATVTAVMIQAIERGWSGGRESVPTDGNGEFRFRRAPIGEPGIKDCEIVVVEAPGLAGARFELAESERAQIFRLVTGATVTGRVVEGGHAVAGIELHLEETSPRLSSLNAAPAFTDQDGQFTFRHVSAGIDFTLFASMDTTSQKGIVENRFVRVPANGSDLALGDIQAVPGLRIAGRVITRDEGPLPAGARLVLARTLAADLHSARTLAADSRSWVLDADGRFECSAFSRDIYSLRVRLPGWRLSRRNPSLDPVHGHELMGMLNWDITDLVVEMEPGKPERRQPKPEPEWDPGAADTRSHWSFHEPPWFAKPLAGVLPK